MGVNWVSLAQDSVGWLSGPRTSWEADGDLQSSRMGKVAAPAGVGVVPGLLLGVLQGPSRVLVGLARQTVCGLRRRAGRSEKGGSIRRTDLTLPKLTRAEPPFTHTPGQLAQFSPGP